MRFNALDKFEIIKIFFVHLHASNIKKREMDILKERILKDGKCLPGGILKVDSFVNHQMDPNLLKKKPSSLFDYFRILKLLKFLQLKLVA